VSIVGPESASQRLDQDRHPIAVIIGPAGAMASAGVSDAFDHHAEETHTERSARFPDQRSQPGSPGHTPCSNPIALRAAWPLPSTSPCAKLNRFITPSIVIPARSARPTTQSPGRLDLLDHYPSYPSPGGRTVPNCSGPATPGIPVGMLKADDALCAAGLTDRGGTERAVSGSSPQGQLPCARRTPKSRRLFRSPSGRTAMAGSGPQAGLGPSRRHRNTSGARRRFESRLLLRRPRRTVGRNSADSRCELLLVPASRSPPLGHFLTRACDRGRSARGGIARDRDESLDRTPAPPHQRRFMPTPSSTRIGVRHAVHSPTSPDRARIESDLVRSLEIGDLLVVTLRSTLSTPFFLGTRSNHVGHPLTVLVRHRNATRLLHPERRSGTRRLAVVVGHTRYVVLNPCSGYFGLVADCEICPHWRRHRSGAGIDVPEFSCPTTAKRLRRPLLRRQRVFPGAALSSSSQLPADTSVAELTRRPRCDVSHRILSHFRCLCPYVRFPRSAGPRPIRITCLIRTTRLAAASANAAITMRPRCSDLVLHIASSSFASVAPTASHREF